MSDLSPHLNVAIVDADSGFVQVLAKRLEVANVGFRVVRGPVSAEALVPMRVNALVIDIALYGADAWTQLEAIRVRMPGLAIVVCTGRTSVAQRVRGLRLGADDWVTKPCHPEEVIARLEAVTRRGLRGEPRDSETLLVGEVEIRPDLFQAFVRGTSGEFTRREFELLQLLAAADGQVLPREEIYERVWGYAMAHGDRSVDVFVRKLRLKLDRLSPRWRYIHTHFGVGYRLAAEPLDGEQTPAVPVPPAERALSAAR
jgi:DNA-binding response OmpR family regulator